MSIAAILEGEGPDGHRFAQVITSLILLSTLTFVLSTEDSLDGYSFIWYFVESLSVLIFSIEYVLRLSVAENVCAYAMTPLALLDLLAVLPSWIDFFFPGDLFPAFQFLRVLRILRFVAVSKRGAHASKALKKSWDSNLFVLTATSYAGGAVWLVTASLMYSVERDNEEMKWCYPPVGSIPDSTNCLCDNDGCEGIECTCIDRFSSIPSAMFFVILNLSGEFPLAEKHNNWGRVVCACTAVVSIAVFSIPTGLVGAALDSAVKALNAGAEEDYDVDDDDAAEIAREAANPSHYLPQPALVKQRTYLIISRVLILLSATAAIISTMKLVPGEWYVEICFYA